MKVYKTPVVSVVMSIFNETENWLNESINSILGQTFKSFEFIIINDNPNRKLNNIILSSFKKSDNRIVIINNEKNIGLTKSLNKGLQVAKGKYIARMDADDISTLDRFEKQVDFMEANNRYVVCGTNVVLFGISNVNRSKKYPKNSFDCFEMLYFGSCFAHPTVMIRADVLRENNIKYSNCLKRSQDYGLWCKLSKYGDFFNIQETLLQYRVSPNQISTKNHKEQFHNAKEVRKQYFYDTIKNKVIINAIEKESISLETIKVLKKYKSSKWALYILYNSIRIKSFKEIFYFCLFDFSKYPVSYSLMYVKRFLRRRNNQEFYL